MKLLTTIGFALLLLTLSACQKGADVSSPNKYEKDNVSFSYPSNWEVSEDEANEKFRYLIVNSEINGMFVLMIYPKEGAQTLDEFARDFSIKAKETPIGKIEKNVFSSIEKQIASSSREGIQETFSMMLFGQDIPHLREYFLFKTENKVVYSVVQSPIEDLNKDNPGFELIYNSLLIEE